MKDLIIQKTLKFVNSDESQVVAIVSVAASFVVLIVYNITTLGIATV